MKIINKSGLLILAFFVLMGGFSSLVPKAHAVANITITSAKITAGNKVTVIFNTGGYNLGTAPITAYGIANDGAASLTLASGGSARDLSGVVITPTTFTAVYTFNGAPATTNDTGSLAVNAPAAILDTNAPTDSLDTSIVSIPLTDGQGPTLTDSNVIVNNIFQPNTVTLTFSEPLEAVQAETLGNYLVTNTDVGITYNITSAVLRPSNVVTLTLATVDPTNNKTFITNYDIIYNQIKVTPSASITDAALNPYAGGVVVSISSQPDTVSATVNATLVRTNATTYKVTFSEKLDLTTSQTLNKYTLSGTCLVSTGNPSAAVLQDTGVDVVLTTPDTSGCAEGQTVIVTPANTITDVAGWPITSSGATKTLATTAIITVSSAKITGPNQITVVFIPGAGTMSATPITAFGAGALVLADDETRSITSLDSLIDNTAVYTFSGDAVALNETAVLTVTNPTNITDTSANTFNASSSPLTIDDGQKPTLVSGQITGPHEITLVYSEPVTSVLTDYISENISGPTDTTAISGSGTNTIKLTFPSPTATTSATGSITIGSTVKDISPAQNTFITVTGQVLSDGQAPTVTINKQVGQADPTNVFPIKFDVVFSEPINPATFDATDITITGSGNAAGITWEVHDIASDGIHYEVWATGSSTDGFIRPFIWTATVKDLAGNDNTISTATDNEIYLDTIAPTIVSAHTVDFDSNGKIDYVVVTYSEAVNDPDYNAIAVAGYTLLGTGASSGAATLSYNLVEHSCATASSTLALTIDNLGTESGNGTSGCFAYSHSLYLQSGSNPTPSITTGVEGGTFSSTPAGLSINPTTGTINLASSSLGTYTVTYTADSNDRALDTGVTPALTFASINATDLAGNNLDLTSAPTNATDAAAPAIVSAQVLTSTTFEIVFSEPISFASMANGDLEYTNAASGSFTAIDPATEMTPTSNASIYVVSVAADNNPFGPGENTGQVKFSSTGVIDDIASPANGNNQTAAVTITSGGIKPTPVSATFHDTNNDGKLDLITIVWSEPITAGGHADDWNITSASDFANLSEGVINQNNGGFASNEVGYNFTTSTVKTDVGDLTLSYNGASVSDGTNNADPVTFTSASTPAFIDGAVPTVTNVTSTLANGTYTTGQIVPITVTFSEPVIVTTIPQLNLATGNPETTLVDYSSGSGTNTLTFNYTVAAGNHSVDLDYFAYYSVYFVVSGSTIKDADGNQANATLATPGTTGSLGFNKAIVIDTVVALATPIANPVANTYTSAQTVTLSSEGSTSIMYSTTDSYDPSTDICSIAPKYHDPISVTSSMTIRAVGCDDAGNKSPLGTFVYTINIPPSTPTATPTAGTYSSAQTVTLSSEGSTSIMYSTTDSYDPSTDICSIAPKYTSPIPVTSSMTIKAVGCDDAGNKSPLGTFVYTINIPSTSHSSSGSYLPGYGPRANIIPVVSTSPVVNPIISSTPTPSSSNSILGSGKCAPELIVTDNMKNGNRNGVYSEYNKGTVKQVKILQAHINRILASAYNQAAGPVDGIYGKLTKQGVERLQKALNNLHPSDKSLIIDGVIGSYTKDAINNSCGNN